jgi:F-type H+-transporting ATPase subunit a
VAQMNPLEQFTLVPVFGQLGEHYHFSQSNLWMLVAGGLLLTLMRLGMAPKAVVPGRLQALAEMSYQGVMSMAVGTIGDEGKRYFPFVFTLFFFVLIGNLLGLLPLVGFAYTSHIAVTFGLAAIVFFLTVVVGISIHKLRFFTYFLPAGAPLWLAPLIIPIEIVSFLSRPFSLAIRLFANMMAGHVMMDVFAFFVVLLGGAGLLGGIAAILPMGVNLLMVGFELLVSLLQAYVFSVLACIYLHDAVHLH